MTLEFLQNEVAGNSLLTWMIAAGISSCLFLIGGVVRLLGARQLRNLTAHSSHIAWPTLLTIVNQSRWLFIFLLALFAGMLVLQIPEQIRNLGTTIFVVALLMQIGLWAASAVRVLSEQYRRRKLAEDPSGTTTLSLLNFFGYIVIWSLVLLLVLDNMGINITALVAGLGVGGIAVALALQAVLADLFASLSIVLDKPFVVGDFLVIDNLMGSVERVGLKSTQLRSLSGEQLIFSNTDLLKSRIRNYGRMAERRVAFSLGVVYDTRRDQLVKIPTIVRNAVEHQSGTRFDRAHFFAYGDFALIFESVYYVLGADYNQYMDIQQAINLAIFEQFEKEDIRFAYPTQRLFLEQAGKVV